MIARPRAQGPPTTPHNTKGVGVHVTSVLEDLDHLSCQGFDIPSPTRQRVIQLGKSATTSMAREAIQIETNRQLRELNCTKGQQTQSEGPSARAILAQKGTRVLTHELKEELKQKAEVRVAAEKEKSERLEKKRQEKAFIMK